MTPEFEKFPSLARYWQLATITEKVDGTNAQIVIQDDAITAIGSRSRWITPADDNAGFAKWVTENAEALIDALGNGRHYGEWYGVKINRGYGLQEKRLALFSQRFAGHPEAGKLFDVVPVLFEGNIVGNKIQEVLADLKANGSVIAPGFMNPEGIVIYYHKNKSGFKITLPNDEMKAGNREWVNATPPPQG